MSARAVPRRQVSQVPGASFYIGCLKLHSFDVAKKEKPNLPNKHASFPNQVAWIRSLFT